MIIIWSVLQPPIKQFKTAQLRVGYHYSNSRLACIHAINQVIKATPAGRSITDPVHQNGRWWWDGPICVGSIGFVCLRLIPFFFLGSCIMLRGGLGFSSTWAARWLFKCQYASSMEGPNNGMQPSCRRCQGRPRNSLGCGPDRKKLHLRNIYKIPQNKKCPPCREDVRLPWPKIPSNRVRIPRISAERRTHWKL